MQSRYHLKTKVIDKYYINIIDIEKTNYEKKLYKLITNYNDWQHNINGYHHGSKSVMFVEIVY